MEAATEVAAMSPPLGTPRKELLFKVCSIIRWRKILIQIKDQLTKPKDL